MIQTSYVPLEKPYQIVEYNGNLGIQIGTLIVTREKRRKGCDGYAIETHSHPVVSYVNKEMPLDLKRHKSLSMPRPFEGVVWDHVELYELNVITRDNEGLTWENFMQLCKKLRLRELENPNFDADIQIIENYGLLQDWGIEIGLPRRKIRCEPTLNVEVAGRLTVNGKDYCHTNGDMGIIVEYTDKDTMSVKMIRQAHAYMYILESLGIDEHKVKFWTQDLFMQDLTDMLKREENCLRYSDDDYTYETPEEYGMLRAAEDIAPREP